MNKNTNIINALNTLNKVTRYYRYHKTMSHRHLKDVNMTYGEHLKHSLNFFFMFSKSSYKAFLHAFIPSTYKTSTTETVEIIFKELEKSSKNNK